MNTYMHVMLWIVAPASALYAFFYTFRPWYRTPQGRALAIMAWGKAVLLGVILLATVWPDYPGREWVRAVAFTLWAVGIIYLLVTLLLSPGARLYPPWNWSRRRMLAARRADKG